MTRFLFFTAIVITSFLFSENKALENFVMKKTYYDSRFHDLHLNFRDINAYFSSKDWQDVLNKILLRQDHDVHMIILKLDPKNTSLYAAAINQNFNVYYGDNNIIELTYCLKLHDKISCSYPPFHTVYTGVTAVLINRKGEALCVKEKLGGETGWKAVTGRVETENGELPIQAAIREVYEELNIHLNETDGKLFAIQYTKDKKDRFPDINFVFLFEVPEDVIAILQENEIKSIKWIDKSFIMGKKFYGLPHVSSLIIEQALQHKNILYFYPYNTIWEDGTEAILYTAFLP